MRRLLSHQEKELYELVRHYEDCRSNGRPIYLEEEELMDMADWYANNYQDEKSEELMDYALRLHPDSVMLRAERINRLIDVGQIDEAEQTADRQLGDSLHSDAVILKARILIERDRMEEADNLLRTYQPDPIDTGFMYLDSNLPERAINWLEEYGGELKGDSGYLLVMAGGHYSLQQYKEAAKAYNQLIDIDSFSPFFWLGLARCHFAMKEYEKSMEACNFAITNDEEHIDAYLLRAYIYAIKGREEPAAADLKTVRELNPTAFPTYDLMHLIDAGRWNDALKVIAFLLDYGHYAPSDRCMLLRQKCYCHMNMTHWKKALAAVEQAISTDPLDIALPILRGYIHHMRGEEKLATESWEKAESMAADSDCFVRMGETFLDYENFEWAYRMFKHALALAPDDKDIAGHLASVAFVLCDKEAYLKYNSQSRYPLKGDKLTACLQMMEQNAGLTPDEILIEIAGRHLAGSDPDKPTEQ